MLFNSYIGLLLSYRLGGLNCILTFAADDDVRLCNLYGLVDNYHEREIKYEGFGGRPSVGGRPVVRALYPPPACLSVHCLSVTCWRSPSNRRNININDFDVIPTGSPQTQARQTDKVGEIDVGLEIMHIVVVLPVNANGSVDHGPPYISIP